MRECRQGDRWRWRDTEGQRAGERGQWERRRQRKRGIGEEERGRRMGDGERDGQRGEIWREIERETKKDSTAIFGFCIGIPSFVATP